MRVIATSPFRVPKTVRAPEPTSGTCGHGSSMLVVTLDRRVILTSRRNRCRAIICYLKVSRADAAKINSRTGEFTTPSHSLTGQRGRYPPLSIPSTPSAYMGSRRLAPSVFHRCLRPWSGHSAAVTCCKLARFASDARPVRGIRFGPSSVRQMSGHDPSLSLCLSVCPSVDPGRHSSMPQSTVCPSLRQWLFSFNLRQLVTTCFDVRPAAVHGQ